MANQALTCPGACSSYVGSLSEGKQRSDQKTNAAAMIASVAMIRVTRLLHRMLPSMAATPASSQ